MNKSVFQLAFITILIFAFNATAGSSKRLTRKNSKLIKGDWFVTGGSDGIRAFENLEEGLQSTFFRFLDGNSMEMLLGKDTKLKGNYSIKGNLLSIEDKPFLKVEFTNENSLNLSDDKRGISYTLQRTNYNPDNLIDIAAELLKKADTLILGDWIITEILKMDRYSTDFKPVELDKTTHYRFIKGNKIEIYEDSLFDIKETYKLDGMNLIIDNDTAFINFSNENSLNIAISNGVLKLKRTEFKQPKRITERNVLTKKNHELILGDWKITKVLEDGELFDSEKMGTAHWRFEENMLESYTDGVLTSKDTFFIEGNNLISDGDTIGITLLNETALTLFEDEDNLTINLEKSELKDIKDPMTIIRSHFKCIVERDTTSYIENLPSCSRLQYYFGKVPEYYSDLDKKESIDKQYSADNCKLFIDLIVDEMFQGIDTIMTEFPQLTIPTIDWDTVDIKGYPDKNYAEVRLDINKDKQLILKMEDINPISLPIIADSYDVKLVHLTDSISEDVSQLK